MHRTEVLNWLREDREERLSTLWADADAVRREHVGDEVHLRGLIEISNHCVRSCAYCGLRAPHRALERYRMTRNEALACARQAVELGYGTVVLQAGEDYGLTRDWVADLVRRIKAETPLAVTLSLGERPDADFVAWRAAGADRYLLRFETSNRALYDRIHPPLHGRPSDRLAILRRLDELGYETGGGVMVGLPGQTYDDLAADIQLFADLDLDMIGLGPYLPHPATPLSRDSALRTPHSALDQVPNSELMTYKVLALTRLVCPWANIPSTTALATVNRESGRELGLARGANVVMPNLTPPQYRALYEIYPAKACFFEASRETHDALKQRILAMGRRLGTGRGDSQRKRHVAPLARGESRGVPCVPLSPTSP